MTLKLSLLYLLVASLTAVGYMLDFIKSVRLEPPRVDFLSSMRNPLFESVRSSNYTLALRYSLDTPNPSYVQMLSKGLLSVTSFSFLKRGAINHFDLDNVKEIKARALSGSYLWPNELTTFNNSRGEQMLIVPDGFIFPGQNDGGLYCLCDPTSPTARPIRITGRKHGWFYHRAVYLRLPGPDGREGVLTARARKPIFGRGRGELVWLSLPKSNSKGHSSCESICEDVWEETVLAEGPDVMFDTVDLDPTDDSIEVISAHFFGQKLTVHSLRACSEAPYVRVADGYVLDTIGQPYGLCLASMPALMRDQSNAQDSSSDSERVPRSVESSTTISTSYIPVSLVPLQPKLFRSGKTLSRPSTLSTNTLHQTQRVTQLQGHSSALSPSTIAALSTAPTTNAPPTHLLVTTHECSYDVWSTVMMAIRALTGYYPRIRPGALVTADYSGSANNKNSIGVAGGSLFAYELPSRHHITDENSIVHAKSLQWPRHTLCSGFKVKGWGGIFSPGAPGFPYVFNFPQQRTAMPLILLAGDCTGSAYIFTPRPPHANSPTTDLDDTSADGVRAAKEPLYDLTFEVECGATVGSAATSPASDGSDAVDIFLPSYELNQVHALRLSAKAE